MKLRAGDVIGGRYRLDRPIGTGGMGTVWSAAHLLEATRCAIKVARIEGSDGSRAERVRARLLREAKIVGSLMHPHIVSLLDIGEVSPGGALYFAMELLEGESLAERLARDRKVPPDEACRVAMDLSTALAAAHEVGIVHGDVKPSNVYLARGSSGPTVKLLDFGISRVHCEGEQVAASSALRGTPAYMSPELALGETDIDPRSDLWSVGVILYEMLEGRRPFDAQNYPGLLARITEEPHAPLDDGVAPELARIVDRCLQKRRDDRVSSASVLAEWLAAPSHAAPSALPPAPAPFAGRPHRRRWIAGAGIGAALMLAGALALRSPGVQSTPVTEAPRPAPVLTSSLASETPTAAPPQQPRIDGVASETPGGLGGSAPADEPVEEQRHTTSVPPGKKPTPPTAPTERAVTRVDHPGF